MCLNNSKIESWCTTCVNSKYFIKKIMFQALRHEHQHSTVVSCVFFKCKLTLAIPKALCMLHYRRTNGKQTVCINEWA